MDGFDQADVIHHPGQMGQHLGEFCATLTMLVELVLRAQDGRVGSYEGVALATNDRGRQGLALQLGQLGFVVKQIQLAGGARHEQMDYVLGLGTKVWRPQRKRVLRAGTGLPRKRVGQQAGQCNLSQADATLI